MVEWAPPMPEMIEVEYYRRVADRTVGRAVARRRRRRTTGTSRAAPPPSGSAPRVTGRTVTGTRRIGKLLLLDTDGPTLGLRFGMTGRLLVDGAGPIERLEYASGARSSRRGSASPSGSTVAATCRWSTPAGSAACSSTPTSGHLGIDALAVTLPTLRAALATSRAPLKAWLLDQGHVAGHRQPARRRDPVARRARPRPPRPLARRPTRSRCLHRHLRRTIRLLTKRGGSHTGDLQVARVRGAACPRDGAPLQRRTIGGRTTYSCPVHQR